MVDETKGTERAAELGTEPLPPIPGESSEAPVVFAPVGNHAGDAVPVFNGLRGGRARLDGLIPGSAEAKKMDQRIDRIRYWKRKPENAGKKHPEERLCPGRFGNPPVTPAAPIQPVTIPAPLPSAVAPGAEPARTETDPLDTLADSAALALERWTGTDLEDVLGELVSLVEEWRQSVREKKARLALLSESTVKELAAASRWNERLKNRVAMSGSRVCAKLLNANGISAAYKDEIILASASIGLALAEVKSNAAFDKLIAAAKNGPPITPSAKT